MKQDESELSQALALVDAAVRTKQPLNRYHARAVLLPLGALLEEPNCGEARSTTARINALVEPVRKAWDQAVREELEMAVTEFVKSVDEQYLTRPGYDFAYTTQARRRLADRLRAAEALSIDCSQDWLRQVERADRVLATHLERSKAPP